MAVSDIILLHGALGSITQLEPLREKLALRFNVYSMNFSGHGGRPFETHWFSIEQFTSEVIAFMEENGLESAAFFGYSLGGYVALNLARQHPEKVEMIFTLATKIEWTGEIGRNEARSLSPYRIEDKAPLLALSLKKRHTPVDWRKLLKEIAYLMLELGDRPTLKEEDLKQISVAVMIGAGSLDKMVSVSECERTADLLPNATVNIFDGWKHPIEHADLDLLSRVLIDFFAQTRS